MNTIGTTTDLTRFTGTWRLDREKTSIALRTKAMWVLGVKGTARALRGNAEVGPDGQVRGTLTIDAASLDTKNTKRDAHLRTDDFLDAATHPTIVFEATAAHPDDAGHIDIHGTLTIRGRARPLVLHAEITGTNDAATVSTDVEIDRSRWGITWGTKMGVALNSRLSIVAHFDRT